MKSFYIGLLSLLFLFSSELHADIYTDLDQIAKAAAAEDADGAGFLCGVGGFGASVLAYPFLGGPIFTLVAYNIKGDVELPIERLIMIQGEFEDMELLYFKSAYEKERAKLQKKENGRGALIGTGVVWVMYIALFTALVNS